MSQEASTFSVAFACVILFSAVPVAFLQGGPAFISCQRHREKTRALKDLAGKTPHSFC